MKVLVDTSVWIDFFANTLPTKKARRLERWLDSEVVVMADIVKHELLVGAATDLEFENLNDLLSALPPVLMEPEDHRGFNRFGFELKKQGLLGSYTDVAIAFLARRHRLAVFSTDRYFARLSDRKIIQLI